VFVHVAAFVSPPPQPPLLVAHSSISLHVLPSPENPLAHVHMCVPGPVEAQVAWASQTDGSPLQSSIAAHAPPAATPAPA
jgi:hypothetical protein